MIHGFGINDVEGVARGDPLYGFWTRMIERCYSAKALKRHPQYRKVSIHPDWKYRSNFEYWAKNTISRSGWGLDKDLFGDGTSYSPYTCCFLPQEINKIFSDPSKNSKTPLGVWYKKKSKGMVNERKRPWVGEYEDSNGKKVCSSFDNIEDAHSFWKKGRARTIKDITVRFDLPVEVRNRLIHISDALRESSQNVNSLREFCYEN